jgi:hypothetical protein
MGPYVVIDQKMNAVALSELDGTPLDQRVSANRLVLYKSGKTTPEITGWVEAVLKDERRLRNLWRTEPAEAPTRIAAIENTDE